MRLLPTSFKRYRLLILVLIFLVFVWLKDGFDPVWMNTDVGRDLKEISNIHNGQLVWLGPWLQVGFNASSAYYYLLYPIVELFHGKPVSLVYFQIFTSVMALIITHVAAGKKIGKYGALLLVLVLGLSPWLIQVSIQPGNGFLYALFSLIAAVGMIFDLPLSLASLALGWASALHPAALLLLPVWLYKFIQSKKSVSHILVNLMLLAVPWLPTIGYEFLTKGFMTRTFFSQPQTAGISIGPSFHNLSVISQSWGLSSWLIIGSVLFAGWKLRSKVSHRKKLLLFAIGILGISLVSPLESRYLFPMIILGQILVFLWLWPKWWGQLILILYLVGLVIQSPLFVPRLASPRTINQVIQRVETFQADFPELKSEKLAVVAAMDYETKVPQADDYRALLRYQGFDVVEVNQNDQADYLIMFIEVPDFDSEHWVNYEIGLFGEKSLYRMEKIEGGEIVVFRSK